MEETRYERFELPEAEADKLTGLPLHKFVGVADTLTENVGVTVMI